MEDYAEIDFNVGNNKVDEIKNNIIYQEKEQNSMSDNIFNYEFDTNRNISDNNVFPVDPNIRTQKLGNEAPPSLIDYNSKILNMDRKLNKDIYINSIDPKSNQLKFNDGFINQESTRLNNPTLDLRGVGPNRFYKLLKNPQENVIQPFSRVGVDTVQFTLDNFNN